MKKNGIPEDQIIVMAYDDIANDPSNPFPGQVFNKPDGEDIYAGCNIDYKGKDVTPENFLHIIKGEWLQMRGVGTGKVLKSDSNSKVFINFADHGAPGLIAFPSEYLYAEDFIDAINYMYENEMYNQMVIYIEACESGSMFDGLLSDSINVYATTAADPDESSWGTYCYPDDVVNGVHMNTCLGDLYSVNWMENDDSSDISTETLAQQFDIVKTETAQSHVMEYGTFDFTYEPVGDFMGDLDVASQEFTRLLHAAQLKNSQPNPKRHVSTVNSRDAKLNYLYAKVMTNPTTKNHIELATEVNRRIKIDAIFEQFAGHLNDE
jgi:legumain